MSANDSPNLGYSADAGSGTPADGQPHQAPGAPGQPGQPGTPGQPAQGPVQDATPAGYPGASGPSGYQAGPGQFNPQDPGQFNFQQGQYFNPASQGQSFNQPVPGQSFNQPVPGQYLNQPGQGQYLNQAGQGQFGPGHYGQGQYGYQGTPAPMGYQDPNQPGFYGGRQINAWSGGGKQGLIRFLSPVLFGTYANGPNRRSRSPIGRYIRIAIWLIGIGVVLYFGFTKHTWFTNCNGDCGDGG